MNRIPIVMLGILAASVAGVSCAEEPPVQASGQERTRVQAHTVRVRIEPDGRAAPGSCLQLTAADLKVRLRGKPIEDPDSIDLDREPRATLHALLIDTSSSMIGKMDFVRQVARDYVEGLRPEDEQAIVVGFDELVTLYQAATSDRALIVQGIDRVRMSSATSLHDALYYMTRELATHRQRPVIVLLTDGLDKTSLYERGDVFSVISEVPGLTVFTVGLSLPPMVQGGPPGINTIRRYLQRLAGRTNGAFFDAPTRSRLPGIYRRIREALDNEARLTVLDPEPAAGRPHLSVKSRRPGCKVRIFRKDDAATNPDREPWIVETAPLPRTVTLSPTEEFRKVYERSRRPTVDPACRQPAQDGSIGDLQKLWTMEVNRESLDGCSLDVTQDYGALYDPYAGMRTNGWVGLKTRPFHVSLVDPLELPGRPEELMDRLSEHALAVRDDEIETDWRCWPAADHARPFHDYPTLANGRVFFDLRRDLARGLFMHPSYRAWVLSKLEEEAGREIDAIARRLQRRSPGSSQQALMAAAYQSEEGRQVMARKAAPGVVDVERHLAGWLGDISAHDMFVAWETERIRKELTGIADGGGDRFVEAWTELRRIFYLPCYARTMTLLSPVRDRQADRVGFWRVVLPRAGWIKPRQKGYKRHPEFTDLPLDLIPDRPAGAWLVGRLLEQAPELRRMLADGGYRVAGLNYVLRGKSGHQDPLRAFRNFRVVLTLTAPGEPGPSITIAADVGMRGPRKDRERYLETLELSPIEDPELRQILEAAREVLMRAGEQETSEGRMRTPRSRQS